MKTFGDVAYVIVDRNDCLYRTYMTLKAAERQFNKMPFYKENGFRIVRVGFMEVYYEEAV